MRKLLSLLLVPLLLLTVALPATGSGYHEKAMEYILEKYGISEKSVQLHEGGIIEFEFTGESFWVARYIIASDGQAIPRQPDGNSPSPEPGEKPEPMPLPRPIGAPDAPMPPSSGSASSPASPPQDIYYDNMTYGAIYIHVKSGTILEMEDMEPYYLAENLLAEQEWARWRSEAGKLEVSLYRRLKGMAATDEVTVLLMPTPVITDALQEQFDTLKAKYPQIGEHLELEDVLFNSYGHGHAFPMPYIRDEAVPPDQGVSSHGGTIGSVAPAKPQSIDGAPPNVIVDQAPGIEPYFYDEEYWEPYQSFWRAVDEIREQAVSASLSDISATLDDLGVTYSNRSTAIEALITVEQVDQIADLDAVSNIMEHYNYAEMDVTPMWRGSESVGLASLAPPMQDRAEETGTTRSYVVPVSLTVFALCAGAFLVYRRSA